MQFPDARPSVDWLRIAKVIFAGLLSAFVGYYFQPRVANNPNAVNAVVTIFSILAGFLIAVITLIAEPVLKQAKDWQELQLMKSTIRRQLLRQNILFFLYLLTLGFALAMFLTPTDFVQLQCWLQMIFLGLATFVFIASFTLPGALMKIQLERYEAALEETRPAVLKEATKKASAARDMT